MKNFFIKNAKPRLSDSYILSSHVLIWINTNTKKIYKERKMPFHRIQYKIIEYSVFEIGYGIIKGKKETK